MNRHFAKGGILRDYKDPKYQQTATIDMLNGVERTIRRTLIVLLLILISVQVYRYLANWYPTSKLHRWIELIEKDGAPPPTVADFVSEASELHNVPERLIYALIKTESERDGSESYSPKGAIGLMQIMPANASRCKIKVSRLWDERSNILCGTQIFKEELTRYSGDARKALITYNGGPKCLKKLCPESLKHADKTLQSYRAAQNGMLFEVDRGPVG